MTTKTVHAYADADWAECTKCGVLFSASAPGSCPVSDSHEPGTERFLLTADDPFAVGTFWLRCSKCSSLFRRQLYSPPQPDYYAGICNSGGQHAIDATSATYTLAAAESEVRLRQNVRATTDWGACTLCSTLIRSAQVTSDCVGRRTSGQTGGHIISSTFVIPQITGPTPWQSVFLPETSAPYPDFSKDQDQRRAYEKFNEFVTADLSKKDIRACYLDADQTLSDLLSSLLACWGSPANHDAPDSIAQSAWDAVFEQLRDELTRLERLTTHFNHFDTWNRDLAAQKDRVMQSVQSMLAAEQDPIPVDALDLILSCLGIGLSAGLGVVGEAIGEAVKAVIEGIAALTEAMVGFGMEIGDLSDWEHRKEVEAVEAAIWTLSTGAFEAFLTMTARRKKHIFEDWGRVQAAHALAEWNDEAQNALMAATLQGYKLWLFQRLLPTRFRVLTGLTDFHAGVLGLGPPDTSESIPKYLGYSDHAVRAVRAGTDAANKNRYAVSLLYNRVSPGGFGAINNGSMWPSEALVADMLAGASGLTPNPDALFFGGGGWSQPELVSYWLGWMGSLVINLGSLPNWDRVPAPQA